MSTKAYTEELKWKQALAANSYKPIIAYAKLMYMWSRSHPREMRKIGAITGHRINNHSLCGAYCKTIDLGTKNLLISQIAGILNQKATYSQKQMF